jgi:hypothetical protein
VTVVALTPGTVPVLCCSAGGIALGLCAEEVTEFSVTRPDAPHLSALLGLTAPGGNDGATAGNGELRTLRLRSGAAEGLVSVDGPVRIRVLARNQLLAIPRFLTAAPGPVIGFHAEQGKVVVLVDVAEVLRLCGNASGARAGGVKQC